VDAISGWDQVKGSVPGVFRKGDRWVMTTSGPHAVHVGQPQADGASWVTVAVDVGPAKRFPPARVLAAAAMLLSGKPVVRGDRLVVRAELRYGHFDAADLQATLREVALDATKLVRLVTMKPERAQTHYSE